MPGFLQIPYSVLQFSLLNWLDVLALVWLVIGWAAFAHYANRRARQGRSIVGALHALRFQWMRNMVRQDVRIADAQILNLFERNCVFFASNALLISAGIITIMANHEIALNILQRLPLTVDHHFGSLALKLVVLLVIFIYAFFAFTWALRQYSFAAHIIVGTPLPRDNRMQDHEKQQFTRYCARLIGRAGIHFNRGLHCFYFGLAALSWFVHPVLLICCTTLIIVVLVRREFFSQAMSTLIEVERVLRQKSS